MTLHAKVLIVIALLCSSEAGLEFLWPLNNATFSAEVIKNTAPLEIFADCGLIFKSDPPVGLLKMPLYTNTISNLTVSMPTITTDMTGKDFSFAGWFKSTAENGTLFHYKTTDSSSILREFKIVLSFRTLQMIRVLNTETNIGTSTTTFALDTWNFVSVGMDTKTGKQIINVNGDKILDIDNNFMDNVDFSLPGNLRIGGAFDDSSHSRFSGYISCFSFFSSSLIPIFSDFKSECMIKLPSTGIVHSPLCPAFPHDAYFANMSPEQSGFEVIAEIITKSVYECALKCLRQRICTNIQFNTPKGSCFLLFASGNSIDSMNGQIFTLQG